MQEYLEHFGVLGMKWGKHNGPPYPLGPDISTGKKLKDFIARRKAASEEKARSKENKKKSKRMLKAKKAKAVKELKEKKNQEKREKRIKELMKDPIKLYKYRDQFTTEEINKMITRYEAEKRLYDYSRSSLNKGKEYIDLVVGYANSLYNAYNVYNKFTGASSQNNQNNQKRANDQNNQKKQDNKSSGDKKLDALRAEKKRLDNEFEKDRLTKENKEREEELRKRRS